MNNNFKIHFWYIIGIAISIIIILLTKQLATIEGLVDYLNFGLTLSALFLALISIIYAIVTNTNFSSQVTILNDSARIISESSSILEEVTHSIEDKIECIPSMITDVSNRIDRGHKEIKDALQYQNIIKDESKPTPSTEDDSHTIKTMDVINSLSLNGLFTVYTCKLSADKKIPFDGKILWPKIKYLSYEYAYGSLMGLSACKLIRYTANEGIFNVLSVHSEISNLNLAEIIEKRVKKTFSEMEENEINEILKESIDVIEEFFN